VTANRTFIRRQLAAAHRARARGDRPEAIRLLTYAIAEGLGSCEENLRVLVEEAQRHADRRRPRTAPPPGRPPK